VQRIVVASQKPLWHPLLFGHAAPCAPCPGELEHTLTRLLSVLRFGIEYPHSWAGDLQSAESRQASWHLLSEAPHSPVEHMMSALHVVPLAALPEGFAQ
jgi:hypothetical protein